MFYNLLFMLRQYLCHLTVGTHFFSLQAPVIILKQIRLALLVALIYFIIKAATIPIDVTNEKKLPRAFFILKIPYVI